MSVKNKKDNVWIQRALVIVFMDILAVLASYMLALFMRFDFVFSKIPRVYLEGYLWSSRPLGDIYGSGILCLPSVSQHLASG